MWIALLSDIHGNPIALDAVLHDAAQHTSIAESWVLSDLVAQRFDTVGVLDWLAAFPNVRFVWGYTVAADKAAVLSMLGRGLPTPAEIAARSHLSCSPPS